MLWLADAAHETIAWEAASARINSGAELIIYIYLVRGTNENNEVDWSSIV